MTLTQEQFNDVMHIVSRYHSTHIKVNMPKNNFVGNLGTSLYSIHISKCCAGLTKALHSAGYDLDMDDNGMEIFKIG